MKRLLNDQMFSLIAIGAQWGLAFIAFMILIRSLSPEDLGVWILYLTLMTIAEQARNGLIQNGYITFLKSKKYHIKVLQSSALILSIAFGIMISVLMLLAAIIVSWISESPDLIRLSLIYPIYVLGSSVLRVWESHCIAIGNFLKLVLTKITFGLIFISTLIIAKKLGVLNLLWLPIFQLIAVFFTLSLAICILSISFSLSDYSRNCIKQLVDYGKYVAGTNITSILINKVDIFILGFFVGPIGVAFYNVASKLINLVEIPLTSISQVVFPKISFAYHEKSKLEAGQFIEQSATLVLAVMVPLCLILVSFAESTIVLVAGEEYRSSAIILQILSCSAIIKSLGRIFGISLDAIGQPKMNYRLILVSAIINVGLNFMLFPFYGIIGIALATCISITLGSTLSFYFLKKDIPIRLSYILSSIITSYSFIIKTKTYEASVRK